MNDTVKKIPPFYDIGLNAIPSLQNDITYGLSKHPLVVETLKKYFHEPITKLNTSFVDTMLIRLQRSMKLKVAGAVIKRLQRLLFHLQSSRHNGKIGFCF